MTGRRGQPPRIGPERYEELLLLLAGGASVTAAAQAMGVTRPTVYNLAGRDPVMGERMAAARAQARAGRRHGTESCYVNTGCRRPECVAAASAARTARRTRPAPPPPPQPQPQPVSVYDLVEPPGPLRLANTA